MTSTGHNQLGSLSNIFPTKISTAETLKFFSELRNARRLRLKLPYPGDQFFPSFPNSIWKRDCPRNSIACIAPSHRVRRLPKLIPRQARNDKSCFAGRSLAFEKLIKVPRTVENVKNAYPIGKWLIENQVILKILHSKRTQVEQSFMRKLPDRPHAWHPRQLLKSGLRGF